jgi:hypothetical protein
LGFRRRIPTKAKIGKRYATGRSLDMGVILVRHDSKRCIQELGALHLNLIGVLHE